MANKNEDGLDQEMIEANCKYYDTLDQREAKNQENE